MTDATILDETSRWRARDVKYWSGNWERIRSLIPHFETRDFLAGPDEPPNPYLRTVVRLPLTRAEKPIPVGVVSNTYSLAQHHVVAEKCFDGMKAIGLTPGDLDFELGLSELGEWMNLRIYFPTRFNHEPRQADSIRLRLECFNSVDGSSRLVILLGWLRLVCTNGLVIGETMAEIRDVHNSNLDLKKIPVLIEKGLRFVEKDRKRVESWLSTEIGEEDLCPWIDGTLADKWGKKAACRVYHICRGGWDVDYLDPFAPAKPTEKPVERTRKVPGAVAPADTLYDVGQALSWVATNRNDAEERLLWQSNVPALVDNLSKRIS